MKNLFMNKNYRKMTNHIYETLIIDNLTVDDIFLVNHISIFLSLSLK